MAFKAQDFEVKKMKYGGFRRFVNETIIRYLLSLGFRNFLYPIIYGPTDRIIREGHHSIPAAIFNTRSGYVRIGEGAVVGNECMFLTGVHQFEDGKLMIENEVPTHGFDITIGKGCWIAWGVTMIGGSSVADNSIVCTGAVVTKKFTEPGVVLAGIPARVVKKVGGEKMTEESCG